MHDFLLAKIFLYEEYLALVFGSLQVREVSVFYIRTHRSLRSLTKTPKPLLSLRSRGLFNCSNPHAICPSLLLKLSISFVYLTAHRGVNISYILLIIVHKFIFVNCSNSHKLNITKCKDLVQNCVSYVIIIAERLHARKDNKTSAHLEINRNK